jgi:type IV fimbrial biogenesis protein FimT
MRNSAHKGFTLVELMVTVSVAAILAGLAVPSLRAYFLNNRLTGGANDLLHSFNLARAEAVKRQPLAGGLPLNVVVCGTTGPRLANPVCEYNTFRGWIVFVDANGNWQYDAGDTIIERHAVLDATVTVKADATSNIVSYAPTGFANLAVGGINPTGFMVLCDSRGVNAVGSGSTARAVIISQTGRARVTASQNDITTVALPNVVGGACP